MTRDFPKTRAALIEYDAMEAHRNHLINVAETNEDILAWSNVCWDDLADVQQAFWEDTKDVNSREHCARADIDFMRRMARGPK